VALRGDPPKGCQGRFVPHPGGFCRFGRVDCGVEGDGAISASMSAPIPKSHPDAADADADIAWLKRKFAAGADRAP
jgi:methylenetetrahydrofolate reductase (NADPH)